MSKGSVAERLANIERQLAGRCVNVSKQERDAKVAGNSADAADRNRALAALALTDNRGRAVIEATFRADL